MAIGAYLSRGWLREAFKTKNVFRIAGLGVTFAGTVAGFASLLIRSLVGQRLAMRIGTELVAFFLMAALASLGAYVNGSIDTARFGCLLVAVALLFLGRGRFFFFSPRSVRVLRGSVLGACLLRQRDCQQENKADAGPQPKVV